MEEFGCISFMEEIECLKNANEAILVDIIEALKEKKNVVVEHTLYKTKRRIAYIDAIRKAIKDINIGVTNETYRRHTKAMRVHCVFCCLDQTLVV